MAEKRPLSPVGIMSIVVGLALILASAFMGLNVVILGLGLLFFALGAFSRKPTPAKVCPFCRSEIHLAATVCPKCQKPQPAKT